MQAYRVDVLTAGVGIFRAITQMRARYFHALYSIDTWILSGDPIFSTYFSAHSSILGWRIIRDYTAFAQQYRNFAPET